MLGRTFVVILFFWAALTVITPILIRLSATANLLDHNGELKNGGIVQSSKEIRLLSRRALGSIGRPKKEIHPSPLTSTSPSTSSLSPSPSPSPLPSLSPSLKLHRQAAFEQEVSDDTRIASITKRQNEIAQYHHIKSS